MTIRSAVLNSIIENIEPCLRNCLKRRHGCTAGDAKDSRYAAQLGDSPLTGFLDGRAADECFCVVLFEEVPLFEDHPDGVEDSRDGDAGGE